MENIITKAYTTEYKLTKNSKGSFNVSHSQNIHLHVVGYK